MTRESDTRQALIFAAERLFGAHGVDAVSLRQINTDAAQKNTSAAHYYFGSKQALITAVFEFRLAHIDKRRLEMLEAVRAAGREHDLRALVGVAVYPIVEETFESEQGEHYIRFLGQVASHPSQEIWALARSGSATAMRSVWDLLRECVPGMPEAIFAMRFGSMFSLTVHSLAEWNRVWAGVRRKTPFSRAAYTSNLCDVIAGMWAAPVSQESLAELNETARSSA